MCLSTNVGYLFPPLSLLCERLAWKPRNVQCHASKGAFLFPPALFHHTLLSIAALPFLLSSWTRATAQTISRLHIHCISGMANYHWIKSPENRRRSRPFFRRWLVFYTMFNLNACVIIWHIFANMYTEVHIYLQGRGSQEVGFTQPLGEKFALQSICVTVQKWVSKLWLNLV